MPALLPPGEVQAQFDELSAAAGGNLSAAELQAFVDAHFGEAGR